MIRVTYDPLPAVAAYPFRLEIGPATHRLSLQQAHELHEQLAGVLMQIDPAADTERPEPPTKPDTPIPIKRASGEHRLKLSEITAAILEEGKGPPK